MMILSNGGGGGGGGGAGDGNVNGGGRKRDHQQVEEEQEEEDHEALIEKIPTGYRFKPTDEELIKHYLYPKVNKHGLPLNLFKDVNIYELHPSDLPGRYKSYEDNEFYFFTPRKRKYQNGVRPDRSANGGYWKANGTDQPILDTKTNKEIGFKRSLVFYQGKPPKSDSKKAENLRDTKSEWLMHEYTLEKLKDQQKAKKHFTDVGSSNHKQLNEFILCKIYIKNGKSKEDIKYPAGSHDQCEEKAVDAAPPSSIANETSSAAAVPAEEHHEMHQNVVAAVGGDHQYPVTSMVATATAEEMEQKYQHYMCQTDVAQMGMMPFNYNCNYLDNGDLSFSSVPSSAIFPSVNHHIYGEMDQQQLQSAILPSVNQHYYYGEMDQHQLQSAVPSVNHNYNGEMNQHQLQPAVLHSVHHYNVEMSQQQLQPGILPLVYQHGQMNQQQLQPGILPLVYDQHGQMNQQQLLQPGVPSVNQHTNGQMNQQQLDEDNVFEMFMAELKNTSIQTNIGFFSQPGVRTDIGPR